MQGAMTPPIQSSIIGEANIFRQQYENMLQQAMQQIPTYKPNMAPQQEILVGDRWRSDTPEAMRDYAIGRNSYGNYEAVSMVEQHMSGSTLHDTRQMHGMQLQGKWKSFVPGPDLTTTSVTSWPNQQYNN